MSKPEIHVYDRDTIEYLRAVGVPEPLLERVDAMAKKLTAAEARVEKLEVLFAGKGEG